MILWDIPGNGGSSGGSQPASSDLSAISPGNWYRVRPSISFLRISEWSWLTSPPPNSFLAQESSPWVTCSCACCCFATRMALRLRHHINTRSPALAMAASGTTTPMAALLLVRSPGAFKGGRALVGLVSRRVVGGTMNPIVDGTGILLVVVEIMRSLLGRLLVRMTRFWMVGSRAAPLIVQVPLLVDEGQNTVDFLGV